MVCWGGEGGDKWDRQKIRRTTIHEYRISQDSPSALSVIFVDDSVLICEKLRHTPSTLRFRYWYTTAVVVLNADLNPVVHIFDLETLDLD